MAAKSPRKPGKKASRKGGRRATGEDTSNYINRDESWLRFNQRVLEEAEDATNPLLERLKFLAITASNLDEFVEIRVAGQLQRLEEGLGLPEVADEGGLTAEQRVARLEQALHSFSHAQDACWLNAIVPALTAEKIHIVRWKDISDADREVASKYFNEQIDPLLTPVTIDPSHPFPRVLNKALCLALLLELKRSPKAGKARKMTTSLGVVTIPRSLPSVFALPGERHEFLLLEDIIAAHLEPMFRGYRILDAATFRVTRNSNLYMQEEESRSVLESVREELHNRRKGDVVRMEIDGDADDEIAERLRVNFELDEWQVFRTDAPVNLSRLMEIYSGTKESRLKYPEFHGQRLTPRETRDIFSELRKRDILLHHPFDSYSAVENFIATAAEDPDVISVKQTLYRTSKDAAMFNALLDAAQNKDVTVVVELMARFDEASNIRWSRELEESGVQVFHGIYGFKTHCKLALVMRRDPDGVIRRYAHLGTGNYNPVTARFYTDISLLTAREDITEAVMRVFRYLTADWESTDDVYRPLLVAPVTLANGTVDLIRRETEHARAGRPAKIIAKMNGLLDVPVIDALYEASQAGVEIDLIVRGMCALRPGVQGLSETIRVRSIVGRFLEHSRIFAFANGGNEEIYCGSADWMPRNLYERCEVVFPVADPEARRRLRHEILEAYLRDNVKARLLQPDGSYIFAPKDGTTLSAQDWLMTRNHAMPMEDHETIFTLD